MVVGQQAHAQDNGSLMVNCVLEPLYGPVTVDVLLLTKNNSTTDIYCDTLPIIFTKSASQNRPNKLQALLAVCVEKSPIWQPCLTEGQWSIKVFDPNQRS